MSSINNSTIPSNLQGPVSATDVVVKSSSEYMIPEVDYAMVVVSICVFGAFPYCLYIPGGERN